MSHSFHHSFYPSSYERPTPRVPFRRGPSTPVISAARPAGTNGPRQDAHSSSARTPAAPAPTHACKRRIARRRARHAHRFPVARACLPVAGVTLCGPSRGLSDHVSDRAGRRPSAVEAEQLDHAPPATRQNPRVLTSRAAARRDLRDQSPLRQPPQQVRDLSLVDDSRGRGDLSVARSRRTRDRAQHQRRTGRDGNRRQPAGRPSAGWPLPAPDPSAASPASSSVAAA